MSKSKEPLFQPLRIPTGWNVSWNTFFEIDARFRSWDDTSWHFDEDMLQLVNRHRGVIVDLGWHPSYRSTGHFRLVAVPVGGDWDQPLRTLQTRSRRKVVTAIEAWLAWYSDHGQAPARKRYDRRPR